MKDLVKGNPKDDLRLKLALVAMEASEDKKHKLKDKVRLFKVQRILTIIKESK